MEDRNMATEDKSASAIAMMDDSPVRPFSSMKTFATAQRMAMILCSSSLVPAAYQGRENLPNCVIALEMANRTSVSPFLIMQNMHVIQGRPSMSAQYLIAMINASGKFSPLRWRVEKRGLKKFTMQVEDGWDNAAKRKKYKEDTVELEDCSYTAYAIELATGETLDGPEVTTQMAIGENWYGKPGSKWKTMPDLMFRYRSAAFFSRMYCPEMAMGLHTTEEMEDIAAAEEPVRQAAAVRADKLNSKLKGMAEPAEEFAQEEPPVIETKLNRPEPAKSAAPAAEPETPQAAPKTPTEIPKPGQSQMDFNAAAPADDAFDIPIGGESDGDPF